MQVRILPWAFLSWQFQCQLRSCTGLESAYARNWETLVLLADYRPHQRVSWQTAVAQWAQDLVDILEVYEDVPLRSPSVNMNVPAVVRLKAKIDPVNVIRYSKEAVYNRDQGRCCYCGRFILLSEATRDHVIPRSQGGRTNWTNIVTACVACNQHKRNRTPQQAGMRLRVLPERPRNLPRRYSLYWQDGMPEEWRHYLPAHARAV